MRYPCSNQISRNILLVSSTSGIFFKIRHLLPANALVSLHYSLFAPSLQYVIVVWGLTYDIHTNSTYLLRKKFVRAISFKNFVSPSTPIYSELKILKFNDLFHIKLLIFVCECVHLISPTFFQNILELLSFGNQYDMRQAREGYIFMARKNTL